MSPRAAMSPERCSAGAPGVGAPGVTRFAGAGGAELDAPIGAESGGGAGPPAGATDSRILVDDVGDDAPAAGHVA